MAESKEIEVYVEPDLQKRLEEEQDMLEKYFNRPGQYPLLNKNNEPCFEHEVILNGDRIYKLRVYVNSEYPNQLPDLVVCESPEQMPKWSEQVGSHSTHTWPPKYGFLRICHWHWAAWKRENMIFQVFNKGEKWLEAYEKYLVTKKLPLDLQDMELTEEEKRKVQIIEQRQLVQFQQQVALEMFTNPNFVNEFLLWQNALREILPLDLEQMELTEDEKTKVQIIEQRQLVQFQQVAHAMFTNPNFVNEFLLWQNALREILSQAQRNLPIQLAAINNDEVEDPHGLLRLTREIDEYRSVNPGREIHVSYTQTDDGRLHFSIIPTGHRSLQNN